jgi:hypothetical protein
MSSISPVNLRESCFRPGFSFAEVMFAVIVLGIGFIMVAAIFPVAIQQTRLTVDESTAAAVARQATSVLEQLVVRSETAVFNQSDPTKPEPLFPRTQSGPVPTPSVYSPRSMGFSQPAGGAALPPPELWNRLCGNLISASDPRFGWTMLYSRADNSQFIRLYIFVLQQRNRSVFDRGDLQPAGPVANLQPRRVTVQVQPSNSAEPDTVLITANQRFAGEGAFLVTADGATGRAGYVYRLGVFRGTEGAGDRYEVDPGYDVPDAPAGTYNGSAWIVGRGLEGNTPTGAVMDVAFYTTFLTVN